MRRAFIINANAGRSSALKKWQSLSKSIRDIEYDEIFICYQGHDLRLTARRALENGYQRLWAVGGDGTVGQVASAFFDNGQNLFRDASLGIIPLGTGSDLYRSLYGRIDVLRLLASNETKSIDVIKVTTDAQLIYGLNTVTIGISAQIIKHKEQLPNWLPTSLVYLLPTIVALLQWNSKLMAFMIDEERLEKPTLAIIISKGFYGGGGMKLGEPDYNSSGNLAITVVPPVSILQVLIYFIDLYRKGLRTVPFVFVKEASKFSLHSADEQIIEVDGELYASKILEVEILSRAISVINI